MSEPSSTSAAEQAGAQIGRYKLLEQIGEGGMGTIWMAEQREPVKRRVALKIIKLGMDTRQVIARFEAERQALALMDHPHIAKVLDAGATETGRPYFVMEYIKGIPILEYCDRERLDTRARLELFTSVCHAIQHAHQKGIIHRDIKPSNVLVTLHDGVPVPKVIDFGIAKATSSELTAKTLFTEHRQMIGTPAYMSPEQAEMSGLDIDTRSDVYSLGVLLYELLTGTTPFDTKKLLESGFNEMVRAIREDEPHKPSTRISSLGDTSTRTAQQRRVELKKLSLLLRGDLDWIVMKCLEKDRTRRYETANGLAADIQRHLRDEPVTAGAPSAGYKLRKFVKRNRGPVLAGTLVAVALVLGIVGTGLSLQRALRAEDDVRTQLTATEDAQKAEKARADELEQVSAFQARMLSQVDPTTAGVRLTEDFERRFAAALVKAGLSEAERAAQTDGFRQSWSRVNATDAAVALIDETILKPAVNAIDEQFLDQPIVDAQLRQVLADRYRGLALYEAALKLQTRALETRRRVLGEEHPDTLTSISNLGLVLQSQGKSAEAEPYCREALEKRRRVLGEEHPDALISINNMGFLLQSQGKLAEAEPYLREALEKHRRSLGEEHPETLTFINNMGSLLQGQGKLAEAEPYYREALEKNRRVRGEEHPHTLNSLNSMGSLLRTQGKLAEAEQYFREALEKRRRVLGEEHPHTLISISNMGFLLRTQGKLAEAEPYHREALEKSRRVLGEEHPNTLTSINNMGLLLQAQGKLAEAEPDFREALEKRRRILGEEHPNTLTSIDNMGRLLQAQGKVDEALGLLRESLVLRRKTGAGDRTALSGSLAELGLALIQRGTLEAAREAEPLVRECLEIRLETIPNDWRVANTRSTLGGAILQIAELDPALTPAGCADRLREAEPLLVDGYRGMKERAAAIPPAHKPRIPEALERVAKLYEVWDRVEPGKGFDAKAAEWREALATRDVPATSEQK